jgi:hypothetical protein
MKPWEAQRQGWPWVPVIVMVLIVVVLGFFGLAYFTQSLGFTLGNREVAHQLHVGKVLASGNYQITQQSKAYQDSQIADMNQNLSNIEGPGGLAITRAGLAASDGEQATLKADELYQVRQFCAEAQNIVPGNTALSGADVPGVPTLKQLIAANCLAGNPVANPPLAMNPVPGGGA